MGHSRFASIFREAAIPALALRWSSLLPVGIGLFLPTLAQAQSIVPANDGTGTQVQLQGNELIIQGGSLSGDRANLFHSFERFNVGVGETARFQSAPGIETILGRVIGGDASRIQGGLQVFNGDSTLILINPAGIVNGFRGDVNVPNGGLTLTTADRINFGANSLDSLLTISDYSPFNGTPTGFEFGRGAQGIVLNEGSIIVGSGQAVRLLGSQVINTGLVFVPGDSGGEITLLAVPGGQRANLTPGGFELQSGSAIASQQLSSPLPQLFLGEVSRLDQSVDGRVFLNGTVIATTAEASLDAVVAGELLLAGEQGRIQIGGDRVALLDPNLDGVTAPRGSLTVQANTISGGSLNGGNVDDRGVVSEDALDITLQAQGDITLDQLLGRNVSVTSRQGDISLSRGQSEINGSRTVRAQTVSLRAPEGQVLLDGGIQAGEVERAVPGSITIEAQRFQAINPFRGTALVEPDQSIVPMSLWAFPANVPDAERIEVPPDPLPTGAMEVRLGEGGIPERLGSGETLISITLQDDVFAIASGIDDPTQPFELGDRSGAEGGIGLGLSRVPPNVNPIGLNNEFVSFESPSAAVSELLLDDGTIVVSAICSEIEEPEAEQPILQSVAMPSAAEELSPEDLGLPPVEPIAEPDGDAVLRAAQEEESISCGRE